MIGYDLSFMTHLALHMDLDTCLAQLPALDLCLAPALHMALVLHLVIALHLALSIYLALTSYLALLLHLALSLQLVSALCLPPDLLLTMTASCTGFAIGTVSGSVTRSD